MAIAIQIDDAFDIETYDGLQAYIINHLELDAETALQLPTFIRKAEYRLNRLVTAPERETSISITTVAGTQATALPVDYRQLRNVQLVADTGASVYPVSLNSLHSLYSGVTGQPVAYTIAEQSILFGPVPDAVYEYRLTYMARLPSLSPTNSTNWLLTDNADAYVYATLMQACTWQEDLDAAAVYRGELFSIIAEMNAAGNRYRNASPIRLRSPVVV